MRDRKRKKFKTQVSAADVSKANTADGSRRVNFAKIHAFIEVLKVSFKNNMLKVENYF